MGNMKILIIGPSWLGDMIMSQALYKALKAKFDCVIHVVAPDWCRQIVERMPEVEKSISLPVKHGELGFEKRYTLAKKLRKENYSHAIVLPNSWKAALVPFLARIPNRIGWFGECRFVLLNDLRYFNKNNFPTMMQRYVALAYAKRENIPVKYEYPSLLVNEKERINTLNKFNMPIEKTKKIIVLCPGAAFGSAKRWPGNYFVEIANEKIKQSWDVWLFGSQQDLPVTENIKKQLISNCKNFAGKLQLSETVDLMSLADVVITNDSGLMHLASALNKYLIAIYGPTSPEFTPPFGEKAKIITEGLPCSPCFKKDCPLEHHQCMVAINPGRILKILNEDGW